MATEKTTLAKDPEQSDESPAACELTAAQFRAAIREALEGDTGDDIDLISNLRYWFSEAKAGDECLKSWQDFASSAMALLPPCDGEGINPCETILNRLRRAVATVELTPAGEKVVNGTTQRCTPAVGLMMWDQEGDTGGIIKSVYLNSRNPFVVFEDEDGKDQLSMINNITLPMAGGLAEQAAAAWREIYDVKTAVQK